jgi:CRISPR-associated protein Csb2
MVGCDHGEQSANLNREDTDSVRLLCADSNTINETWHDWNYGEKVDKPDPPWNLMAETKQLHDVGWSDPPGSRWVTYFRPRKALISQHRSARLPDSVWLSQWQLKQGQPCVARYLIDGAVRPLVQDTVYFAEIVRRYVQGIYGKQNHGASSPSFSGKQADGTPSAGHSHAFYLPLDEDGDGKLDHMLIIMPSGISDAELRALNNLSQVRGPSNTTVTLSLTTIQSLEYEQMTRRSKKWRSITPFIATRHYKERGVNKDKGKFLFEQLPEVNLREELVNCGLPVPARVTPIEAHRLSGIERDLPWREFRQQRVFAQYRRGSHFGRGFEIEFLEPVPGPISVGYACHFGLGMFMPVDE